MRLAEKNDEIRKAIALYLTEKAKNGTPRQREIAKKILKRDPPFLPIPFCILKAGVAVNRLVLNQNIEPGLYVELTTAWEFAITSDCTDDS